jgi:hypothetical protein
MTDTTLLRVLNPRAFLLPDLNAFILKALGSSPLTEDPQAALLELVDAIHHPGLGLFVVREGSQLKGLALCENNTSAMSPGCMVLHFYAPGAQEARKALLGAIADFARAGGNSKIWGIDVNCRGKGFARMFKALGAPTVRGQLFEFDVTDGEL